MERTSFNFVWLGVFLPSYRCLLSTVLTNYFFFLHKWQIPDILLLQCYLVLYFPPTSLYLPDSETKLTVKQIRLRLTRRMGDLQPGVNGSALPLHSAPSSTTARGPTGLSTMERGSRWPGTAHGRGKLSGGTPPLTISLEGFLIFSLP